MWMDFWTFLTIAHVFSITPLSIWLMDAPYCNFHCKFHIVFRIWIFENGMNFFAWIRVQESRPCDHTYIFASTHASWLVWFRFFLKLSQGSLALTYIMESLFLNFWRNNSKFKFCCYYIALSFFGYFFLSVFGIVNHLTKNIIKQGKSYAKFSLMV